MEGRPDRRRPGCGPAGRGRRSATGIALGLSPVDRDGGAPARVPRDGTNHGRRRRRVDPDLLGLRRARERPARAAAGRSPSRPRSASGGLRRGEHRVALREPGQLPRPGHERPTTASRRARRRGRPPRSPPAAPGSDPTSTWTDRPIGRPVGRRPSPASRPGRPARVRPNGSIRRPPGSRSGRACPAAAGWARTRVAESGSRDSPKNQDGGLPRAAVAAGAPGRTGRPCRCSWPRSPGAGRGRLRSPRTSAGHRRWSAASIASGTRKYSGTVTTSRRSSRSSVPERAGRCRGRPARGCG